jgi:hypothetical protein
MSSASVFTGSDGCTTTTAGTVTQQRDRLEIPLGVVGRLVAERGIGGGRWYRPAAECDRIEAAPGLFSTMTGCRRCCVSLSATSRAIVSALPPGGNVTTMCTCRAG